MPAALLFVFGGEGALSPCHPDSQNTQIHDFSLFGDVTVSSTDPKLTPKMSTGNHSGGRQKHEFAFLMRFVIFLFFGSNSDVSDPGFITHKKTGFLNYRWGVFY